MNATLDRIEAASGKRPVGWLGAGLAETWNTLDYLAEAGPRGGPYTMNITYRPAKFEDLEDAARRFVQEAGNELRVRHGRQPWPAPPPIAFPKFCLAEDPRALGR